MSRVRGILLHVVLYAVSYVLLQRFWIGITIYEFYRAYLGDTNGFISGSDHIGSYKNIFPNKT